MPKFGFNKPANPKHIVAERYCGTPWPKAGPAAGVIATTRLRYERGEIEMATRREGQMEYLYAIPRKVIGTLRPNYFKPQQ